MVSTGDKPSDPVRSPMVGGTDAADAAFGDGFGTRDDDDGEAATLTPMDVARVGDGRASNPPARVRGDAYPAPFGGVLLPDRGTADTPLFSACGPAR